MSVSKFDAIVVLNLQRDRTAMIAAMSTTVVNNHFQAISRLTCLSSGENNPTGLGFSSPSLPFSESPFCCALLLGRSGEFSFDDMINCSILSRPMWFVRLATGRGLNIY